MISRSRSRAARKTMPRPIQKATGRDQVIASRPYPAFPCLTEIASCRAYYVPCVLCVPTGPFPPQRFLRCVALRIVPEWVLLTSRGSDHGSDPRVSLQAGGQPDGSGLTA